MEERVRSGPHPFYVQLGLNVRRYRTERGLTQEELADEVDLSRASVANLEGGRQACDARTLVLLSKALAVPITALVRDCLLD